MDSQLVLGNYGTELKARFDSEILSGKNFKFDKHLITSRMSTLTTRIENQLGQSRAGS
jgi:hypothetical protein